MPAGHLQRRQRRSVRKASNPPLPRARAHYVLAESGSSQPRTLAGAFVKPVQDVDLAAASIELLEDWRTKLDRAYGPAADATVTMNVAEVRGALAEIIAFCRDAAGHA